MEIKDFGVEMWMNAYENDCTINLAETCVKPFTVGELLALDAPSENGVNEHLQKISELALTYGAIEGSHELRKNLAKLYRNKTLDNITVTHGAIGANALIMNALVEPGDIVISVLPTYQQLYSIPESYGADVRICRLTPGHGFTPDPAEIRKLAEGKAKLICINNPNNPTGAVMDEAALKEIVEIAKECDAWVLCDEAYRGLNHDSAYTNEPAGKSFAPSIVDLYDKGVASGSFSKTFSLAGLRMGWVCGPEWLIDRVNKRRDYSIISCGVVNDYLASIAIAHRDDIIQRNTSIVNACAQVLDEWVQGEPHISYVAPKGGTTAFLHYDLDVPSAEFCDALQKETGVMLLPGSAMDCEGWLRIGYCFSEDTSTLERGLAQVSEFMKN